MASSVTLSSSSNQTTLLSAEDAFFRSILGIHRVDERGMLKMTASEEEIGITQDTLHLLLRRCLSRSMAEGTHLFTAEKVDYVVTKEGDKLKELHTTFKTRTLGEGGCAKVSQLYSLIHGAHRYAYKVAKQPQDRKRFVSLYRKLANIEHRYERVSGLPKPPTLVQPLSDPSSDDVMPAGLLMEAYRTDLHKAMNLELEFNDTDPDKWQLINQTIVRGLYQLLTALNCLIEEGIVHGDIKPGNIFLSKSPEGHWIFDLNDFDGAKYMRNQLGRFPTKAELVPSPDMPSVVGAPGTPQYMCTTDLLAITNAARNSDRDEYIRLQHARDMFALGLSMIFAASRRRAQPYVLNKHKMCDPSTHNASIVEILRAYKLSEGVIKILVQMIDPNPRNRGVPAVLLENLKGVIRSAYPEMAQALGLIPSTASSIPHLPSSSLPSTTTPLTSHAPGEIALTPLPAPPHPLADAHTPPTAQLPSKTLSPHIERSIAAKKELSLSPIRKQGSYLSISSPHKRVEPLPPVFLTTTSISCSRRSLFAPPEALASHVAAIIPSPEQLAAAASSSVARRDAPSLADASTPPTAQLSSKIASPHAEKLSASKQARSMSTTRMIITHSPKERESSSHRSGEHLEKWTPPSLKRSRESSLQALYESVALDDQGNQTNPKQIRVATSSKPLSST